MPPPPSRSGFDAGNAALVLDALPAPVALCTAEARLLGANAALRMLLDDGADTLPEALRLGEADARRLRDAVATGGLANGALRLHDPQGGWWSAQVAPLPDGRRVVQLVPADAQQRAEAEADRLAAWLEAAQDFGRLGVWERDLRTLQGRWDRHMHRFWGLDPAEGTPDFARAVESVVAEDRAALDAAFRASMARAGTYSHRYRVRTPAGEVRRLHSQWRVVAGADGRPERAIGVLFDDTEIWDLARAQIDTVEQLALDLGQLAAWRHDLRSGRVHLGPNAAQLLGMADDRGEVEPHQMTEFLHPDDVPAMQAALEQALAGGGPVDAEARVRRADGGWRHLLTRRVLQRDAEGAATAVVGVALDVGERQRQAREQTERVRQFELTAQAAGIGYWSEAGDTGQARWSEQTYRIHGLPPGAPALPMAQWLERFVPPEDRDDVRRRFADWVRSGRHTLEIEFRIVRADGAVRRLQSTSRREGPHGAHDFYGVLQDVTERRAADAELRAAAERTALATRGAGLGTWEVDLLTGATFWDEQMWRLRGLEPRAQAPDLAERLAMVHPDDLPMMASTLESLPTVDGLTVREFRIVTPDGRVRWLASRSSVLLDESGRCVRRIGVNWDITDARSAQIAREERELAQRESRAKSQFLSRMSHELRTPLNAVLGFAQLLLAGGENIGADTRRRHLEQIESAGRHLLSLIDDVLDLSSLESGELRVAPQPTALAPAVEQALPLVARLARRHKVRVRADRVEGVVQADPTRLRQVLLNLLTNAVKYNREGGQVLVESAAADGGRVLRVTDTGRGMSAEQLRQAFEPFNRLGREHEGIEGTGIGLAIVKTLVERMGGRVRATSTPGAGSRFEVWLPAADLAADGPQPAAEAAAPLPAHDLSRPGRVLYIEDNPVNVLIVQELVARRGDLQFDSAADGSSGVGRAAEVGPDLVLVDMQLPDIDGLEVLRRLRSDPRTRSIPCIAVSANAMPEDIERALQAGFADYWTKPLDFGRFRRSIDAMFGPTSKW